MIYIETQSLDAAFHFSLEEYIVRHYPWDEKVFMIWQTNKCAMLGSYQIAETEIDLKYAKSEGIAIVRRSSGGGTIYTDPGAFLFTVIQPKSDESYPLDIAKSEVAAPVVDALRNMGIPAKLEGRNDILVDGKKVSGLAQYTRHGRICTHGSLLYETDLETLVRVLRVDDDKIRSKALRSIRSRVTNIKEHMDRDCSRGQFREQLKRNLFSGQKVRELTLTEFDLTQIDSIYREKYGDPSWTFTQSPKFSFHNSKRFAGGKVEVYLDVEKGLVSSCSIRGDFLGVAPISALEDGLEGIMFQRKDFTEALEDISLQQYLGNITIDELLSCFFE